MIFDIEKYEIRQPLKVKEDGSIEVLSYEIKRQKYPNRIKLFYLFLFLLIFFIFSGIILL